MSNLVLHRVGEKLERLTPDGKWHLWPQGPYDALVRQLPDGRYVAVFPFLFTWGVVIGTSWATYDDRWCYHDMELAIAAAFTWDGNGDPPDGWHRHTTTGRRRPDGDPAREYVNP